MKAGAKSNPLECIGGGEKVMTTEGDGCFGEKDGLKALQSNGKPRSLQACLGRCDLAISRLPSLEPGSNTKCS